MINATQKQPIMTTPQILVINGTFFKIAGNDVMRIDPATNTVDFMQLETFNKVYSDDEKHITTNRRFAETYSEAVNKHFTFLAK